MITIGQDELLITLVIPLNGEHPDAVVQDVLDSVLADYPETRIHKVIRHKNGAVIDEKFNRGRRPATE